MDGLTSELRGVARAAFDAAVAAVQPERLLATAVRRSGGAVEVAGLVIAAPRGRRVVAALGKAAPGLASGWLAVAGRGRDELVVLTPHGVPVARELRARATVWRGAHPVPDADGEVACRTLLELAGGLGADDQLVVLLSGGASALLTTPRPGLTLETVRVTTRLLLAAGATIGELNTVRRELLAAAGGGLARAAFPAEVVAVALSDVIGDPPADVASGPTVPSPTDAGDALAVLRRFRLAALAPPGVVDLLEERRRSPTVDRGWAARSRVAILGSNRTAVAAAATALELRGYPVAVAREPLRGEASVEGRRLGGAAAALAGRGPAAMVLGGETTVTVRGPGRGGRSQELALAAALAMRGGAPCALLAAGTDGVDGASVHAGAVVDPSTAARLEARGIDPEAALAANDSGTALGAVGDAIVTGPTGTNVGDLVVVVAGTAAEPRRRSPGIRLGMG